MNYKLHKSVQDWEKQIGGDIRTLRHRMRLTQGDLAELANVSPSAIKYLEAGKGSSLATLVKVARALERTDWLASFAPPQATISPMAVLREQRRAQESVPKRVRRPVRTAEV